MLVGSSPVEDLYHILPSIIEKIVERRLRLDSCSGNHLIVRVEGDRQSTTMTIDVEMQVFKKIATACMTISDRMQ